MENDTTSYADTVQMTITEARQAVSGRLGDGADDEFESAAAWLLVEEGWTLAQWTDLPEDGAEFHAFINRVSEYLA